MVTLRVRTPSGNESKRPAPFEVSNAIYGLDIGDLNGDGFKNIAVANSGLRNLVFLDRPLRK